MDNTGQRWCSLQRKAPEITCSYFPPHLPSSLSLGNDKEATPGFGPEEKGPFTSLGKRP